MKIRYLIGLGFLLCSLATSTCLAQNLELSAKLVSAIHEADDAFDTLDTLHTAALDALAGKRVSAGTNWSRLADLYSKAALDTSNVGLPSEMVISEPVAASDFASCPSRRSAVAKANSFVYQLTNARSIGQQSIVSLNAQLDKVANAKKALAYLIDVHAKLIQVPVYGDLFIMNWVDLNSSVTDALGDLGTAYQRLKDRYEKDAATLAQKIANIESNLALLTPCPEAGTWGGSAPDWSWKFTMADGKCVDTNYTRNLTVSVTITEDGKVTNGQVMYTPESVSGPGCFDYGMAHPAPHALNFPLKSGSASGDTVTATFMGIGCTFEFSGRVVAGRLNGTLKLPCPMANTQAIH